MYNVFEYLKYIRSSRAIHNIQDTSKIHEIVFPYNYPIPSKSEPCEIDKPVPQKHVTYN